MALRENEEERDVATDTLKEKNKEHKLEGETKSRIRFACYGLIVLSDVTSLVILTALPSGTCPSPEEIASTFGSGKRIESSLLRGDVLWSRLQPEHRGGFVSSAAPDESQRFGGGRRK